MASSYTENYGLCQWEAADSFIRTEFNGDNQKVDAALHALEVGKADRAALTALTTEVGKKAAQSAVTALSSAVEDRCRMKAGTYAGDGAESQYISVGFPVKAVLVENESGSRNSSHNAGSKGGLAVAGGPLTNGAVLVKVSGSGFYVYTAGEYQGSFNGSGVTYYYVAWG